MSIGKMLNDYYNKKYGKNWSATVPKRDYICFIMQFVFSVLLFMDCILKSNTKTEFMLCMFGFEFSLLILFLSPYFNEKILIQPLVRYVNICLCVFYFFTNRK